MEFKIVDTAAAYRRLLDMPDVEQQSEVFRQELVEPFAGLARVMGGDPLTMFAQWNLNLDGFAPENRDATRARLDALTEANAFARSVRALERGYAAFAEYHLRIHHNTITFGLYLCDLSALPQAGGYSGFGAIPGWIMTLYDTPTERNLRCLEACTVHELHHNLAAGSDSGINFNIMTMTLGDYMVMEGLAESFAAELYGEDTVGPWVTNFDESRLEDARALFKSALRATGFDTLRRYIFGDEIMGGDSIGAPLYSGYALGYKVVQAYLQRTGKTVVEATYTPAEEIIAESGFFA